MEILSLFTFLLSFLFIATLSAQNLGSSNGISNQNSNSNQFGNSGNVGIGTNNPIFPLGFMVNQTKLVIINTL